MLEQNLDLLALRYEIPKAEADVITAGLRSNPIFYADTQFIPYGANNAAHRPIGPTQYDVMITYPLDVSRKRRARVLVALSERRLSLRGLGLATVGLTVLAAALLPVMPPASGLIAVFFVLFGPSNGMMTILRALLPPKLFGPADNGAIQGVIAMPVTFAKAAGPFLLAAVWSWTGATGPVLGLAVMLALASALVFALAVAPSKTRAEPASLETRSGRAAE